AFDLGTNIKPQIGGDLLIAATAGVQLEAKRAELFGEPEFDEVVNIFGCRVVADQGLARVGGVGDGNCVEGVLQLRCFTIGQDTGCTKSGRVRLAGGDFFV